MGQLLIDSHHVRYHISVGHTDCMSGLWLPAPVLEFSQVPPPAAVLKYLLDFAACRKFGDPLRMLEWLYILVVVRIVRCTM